MRARKDDPLVERVGVHAVPAVVQRSAFPPLPGSAGTALRRLSAALAELGMNAAALAIDLLRRGAEPLEDRLGEPERHFSLA